MSEVTQIVVKHHDGTHTLVDLDPTDLASINRLADVVRRNRPQAQERQTAHERRNAGYIVALQLLYHLGQKEKNRFLTQVEMLEAMRVAEEFCDSYFGKDD